MGWNSVLPSYSVGVINIPPSGCFNTTYFRSKAKFQSCQVDVQYETSSSAPALSGSVSRSQISPEVEVALNEDWTLSIAPSGDCLQGVRSDFLACRGNLVTSFGNALLHCVGIKRKWQISEGTVLTVSCSPDTDLCFFGVQFAVDGIIGPREINIMGQRRNCRIRLRASLTIRFNLNPAGWARLIRLVGTRALNLLSRVPGAAARIVAALTGTAAIIVVGTVILTALLVYGMAYFIDSARRSAVVLANSRHYAHGYVDALIRPELNRTNYQDAIDRYRGHDAKINGYVDAIHNAMQFGYRRTRLRLLERIGLNGVLDAEGPGGDEFLFSFGGGRFPSSTRNFIAGALQYKIEHNSIRPITIRVWIDRR